MPTRRQMLEAALVAERTALWGDFDELPAESLIARADVVRRIRLASEALGYPSDPSSTIPLHLLRVYKWVETCPPLGIVAARIDWGSIEDHWVRCPPLSDEEQEVFAWKG